MTEIGTDPDIAVHLERRIIAFLILVKSICNIYIDSVSHCISIFMIDMYIVNMNFS